MILSEAYLKSLPRENGGFPILPKGNGVFVIETLPAEIAGRTPYVALNVLSGWKLVSQVKGEDASREACRKALVIRDDKTTLHPVVRVRELNGVTEWMSQRMAFRHA